MSKLKWTQPTLICVCLFPVSIQGAEDLNELWQSTGFTWEQFLPSDENVAEFVREKVKAPMECL